MFCYNFLKLLRISKPNSLIMANSRQRNYLWFFFQRSTRLLNAMFLFKFLSLCCRARNEDISEFPREILIQLHFASNTFCIRFKRLLHIFFLSAWLDFINLSVESSPLKLFITCKSDVAVTTRASILLRHRWFIQLS